MHKFVFRLQKKLDISERQEQIAKEQLSLRIKERNAINDSINNQLTRLNRYENLIKDLPFKQTLVYKEYLPILRNYIKELQEELDKAEEKVEIARTILLECKKETKTLTKLRENEWEKYLSELNKEEQKEIDEIAINKHFRNK